MAIVYLEPDDLSDAQQARVLRVLNLATDAAALAAAIEMPGEPDIGIKLAERLLRARTALNGQFTTLSQVASVPYMGLERFTDLCVAILGLQREQLAKLGAVAGQRLAGATVNAYAGIQLALQIDTDPQPAWLGQTLQITITATQNGAPLVNRSITLETSLGKLTWSFGFALQAGSALVIKTGADGRARLTLDYQPYEPLTQDQDNALQLALADLDATAATPDEIRVAFTSLAEQYDDEPNVHLRAALDIYSKEGERYWQRFNASNAAFEWPQATAVLRAYLHSGTNAQGVLASSVSIVTWINWIPAWFNYLHEWLANRAALAERLAKIKRKGLNGYALVDNLVDEAHIFVASQKGFAGELVSQHLVSDSVNRFLSTQIDDLPDATKRVLFPSLQLAAEQIRAGNRGSLELVSNTRGALKADIADIANIDAGVLEEIRNIREDVGLKADTIRNQLDGFAKDRNQFNEDLAGFQRDHAQFTDQFGVFENDAAQINNVYGNFVANFADFSREYSSFSESFASFTANYRSFTANYATFNNNYTTFNSNYSTFNTNYSTFNTNYSAFNTNYSAFNANYATFNNNYASFNTNYSTFNTSLVTFNNNLGTFNTNLGNFNNNLGTFNNNLGSFNTNYNKFNVDLAGFNQRSATITRDLATVNANVATLQTQNTQLSNQVASMNTGLTQVKTDITGINQKLIIRGPG